MFVYLTADTHVTLTLLSRHAQLTTPVLSEPPPTFTTRHLSFGGGLVRRPTTIPLVTHKYDRFSSTTQSADRTSATQTADRISSPQAVDVCLLI